MSIGALSWALHQDQIDNPSARSVLFVLANYADENGSCFPSIRNIARKTSMSERSVIRSIGWLVDNGYIETEKTRRHSKYSYNRYFIVGYKKCDQGDNLSVDTKDLSSPKGEEINTSQVQHDPIDEVFNYYKIKLKHPRAKLDSRRKSRIRARLREGFSVDDLKKVIDGVLLSPYHMGDNATNTVYDGIQTIFRDAEQVEKFTALASKAAQKQIAVPVAQTCDKCTSEKLCMFHDPNSAYNKRRTI